MTLHAVTARMHLRLSINHLRTSMSNQRQLGDSLSSFKIVSGSDSQIHTLYRSLLGASNSVMYGSVFSRRMPDFITQSRETYSHSNQCINLCAAYLILYRSEETRESLSITSSVMDDAECF